VKKRVQLEREPQFREDFSPKEQPLLEAVTRQLLVKTMEAGKNLKIVEISDDAGIICSSELWV
jgi:hypothetical protein